MPARASVGATVPSWGLNRKKNQYLMSDAVHGIREARTVMSFPDELKFDVDLAQAVNIAPQHIHESSVHDEAFREPIFPQAPIPGVGENATTFKRLYVRQVDLTAFGYTHDCVRCSVRCKHAIEYGARPYDGST